MVATVVVMILFWQGRHFVGTVSLDDKLTLSTIQNRTVLILLETTSYNIHKPGSQTSMSLESAWLVHKMKKTWRNILSILISVYKPSQVKGPIISSGIKSFYPLMSTYLYAEDNFFTPIKLPAPWVGAVRLRSKRAFFCEANQIVLGIDLNWVWLLGNVKLDVTWIHRDILLWIKQMKRTRFTTPFNHFAAATKVCPLYQ